MHLIYVLRSKKDNNLYIGCTSDLEKRIKMHNNGFVRSTKNRRPLEIVFKENYEDKYEAFRKERFYKSAKGKRELLNKIGNV